MKRYSSGAAILGLLIIVAVFSMGHAAWAQAPGFPAKPVRIVVPYPAGGDHDALGRGIATRLSDKWKQPVIIENRPGGGSVIGNEAAAKAEPDGHTLLFASVGLITSQLSGQKLPYDPAELHPSMLVATTPLILFMHPGVTARDFNELIAYAKANPRGLTFGSAGNGSSPHLAAELFAVETGVEITHVPYKGIAPAIIDVLAGHTRAIWAPPPMLNDARAGKVRALVTASATRLLSAPEIPTTAELGYPGLSAASWSGFLVHAKTPAPIREQIYRDLREVTLSDATRAQILQLRYEPAALTETQFAQFLRDELLKWGKVIRERKLKLD